MATVAPQSGPAADLPLRLISAAILIPFGLFVVWTGGPLLAACCGLFAALMAYEWVRMSASPSMKGFVSWSILPFFVVAGAGLVWAVGALLLAVIAAGVIHPKAERRAAQAFGMAYVAGMPLALYALRSGPWDGAAAALIFMGIVWGSDSAAYFSGRGFGGPALHPDSPSKTWSGSVGAIIFTALCGVLAARITGGELLWWCAAGVAISIVAQGGDLFESSIKRRFGVKDSSGLLPGHGGLLDRVDGLGMVCSVAALVFFVAPSVPRILGL